MTKNFYMYSIFKIAFAYNLSEEILCVYLINQARSEEEVPRTEKNYIKKGLNDPDNHNTHLKPDMLECEVKWT